MPGCLNGRYAITGNFIARRGRGVGQAQEGLAKGYMTRQGFGHRRCAGMLQENSQPRHLPFEKIASRFSRPGHHDPPSIPRPSH